MSKHFWSVSKSVSVALFLLGVLFSTPLMAYAAMTDVSVSPIVLDGKGKVREILRFHVTLTNNSKHLQTVYPWVTDFDANVGSLGSVDLGGSGSKDLSESLARWIEVTRGSVDLLPGDTKEVPLTVQINLNAKPGVYHAIVHFSSGADRANAESNLKETQDVAVNIEVLEDINERLQLAMFSPVKQIFSTNSASFQYRLENIGNRGEVPRGNVRIFDRDGREVATIEANKDGTRLEPAGSAMLSSVWSAGGSFGRYKAMIDLEYGNRGTIQDTVFFWMIPWGKLISMFLTLILACVIIGVIFHSRMTAGRGELGYASVPPNAPLSSMREKFSTFFSKKQKREYDEEGDTYVTSRAVSEMREVTFPEPVRSKMAVISRDIPSSTHLQSPDVSTQKSEGHKVTLKNIEKEKVSPHHVVNLRK